MLEEDGDKIARITDSKVHGRFSKLGIPTIGIALVARLSRCIIKLHARIIPLEKGFVKRKVTIDERKFGFKEMARISVRCIEQFTTASYVADRT